MVDLHERPELLLARLQDASGAYPASPTFSAYSGYSWFRDGAFIADGASAAGLADSADRFFGWCARALVGCIAPHALLDPPEVVVVHGRHLEGVWVAYEGVHGRHGFPALRHATVYVPAPRRVKRPPQVHWRPDLFVRPGHAVGEHEVRAFDPSIRELGR